MDQLVLETGDVRIRYCPAESDALLVVTFANLLQQQTKDQLGFGERLLRAAGISAVHVTCRENRWYQYPELLRLREILAPIRARYREAATYGSSMGGYAAILFSGAVRADRVVAGSPQYSIDPRKVPYDRTWNHIAKDTALINDEIGADVSGTVFLIYDDRHVDGQHADRIAAEMPVHRIVTPHAGHPAVHFLHRAGLLKELSLNLLSGRYDEGRVRAAIRGARGLSAGHLCHLARRGRSMARKLRLLDMAEALEPNRVEVHAVRGQLHNRTGNLAAAAEAFRGALAASPRHDWSRNWLADVLSRAGSHAEAVGLAQEAVARSPGTAEFHHTLGQCLYRAGCDPEAERPAFETATRLDPANARYRASYDAARRRWGALETALP